MRENEGRYVINCIYETSWFWARWNGEVLEYQSGKLGNVKIVQMRDDEGGNIRDTVRMDKNELE